MRCLILVSACLIFLVVCGTGQTASVSPEGQNGSLQVDKQSTTDQQQCPNIIFVESPWRDTYTSVVKDSAVFGVESTLKVRGAPAKKSMHALVSFYVPKVDQSHIEKCYLRVYTVSKKNEGSLLLYNVSAAIDEMSTNWHNQPQTDQLISSQDVIDDLSVEFEITDHVLANLDTELLRFGIRSDGKRPVEIASRESGLGAELILHLCPPVDQQKLLDTKKLQPQEYSFKVFPCPTSGKFTVELIGVPVGGFAECMLMNDGGTIVRKYPLAIREGDILYHSLELGDLSPGSYYAVFRKGRIVLRDEFRLVPSKDYDQTLEVAAN